MKGRVSEAPPRVSRPSLTGRVVRDSLAVMRAWVPLWRPRHRWRSAAATLALGAALLILAWTAPQPVKNLYLRLTSSVGALAKLASLTPASHGPPATVRLARSTMPGGFLHLPPTFTSTDGSYDLVLHFHGNVGLVEESFAVAGIDAAVVILNAGLGTGAYDQLYRAPAVIPAVLARVEEDLVRRGIEHPRRRRVAVTAWSAGWGAVSAVLDNGVLGDSLDAIVLLDGLHSSYLRQKEIDTTRLAGLEAFARRAMRDERLLTITHSEIETYTYPSTHETSDALLGMLGLARTPGGPRPELPALSQFYGIPRDKLVALVPTSECHAGSFHLRGYTGTTAEDHMMHLAYMASIALPDLARRWNAR